MCFVQRPSHQHLFNPLVHAAKRGRALLAYEDALYGGRELQHACFTSVLMRDAERIDKVVHVRRT